MLRKGLVGGIESGESSIEDTLELKPVEPSQRFDHYELLTGQDGKPVELGRGAMGVTYKAFDINLRCPVTLKVIGERYLGDDSALLRFLREARAAASVRHPNVASVFHLGRTGDNYFYAMEFVDGETLEKLIKRSIHLEVKLALEIALQVAAGLAAVHEQNLVHRDIKPSNIMVSLKKERSVTAKIIDLGLAKTLDASASEAGISSPGAFAGTPEFASPEQFAGVGVDIRSDLYSLGVTLWEMLTGKAPFQGTPSEVMHQHQHAPLPLEQLEDVPQPVVVLLAVLLEKDPTRRFQDPTELLKVVPAVMRAVEARRTIKHQDIRLNLLDRSNPLQEKPTAIRVPKRSIAVLPFETLGQVKGKTYFADGIQDEILSNLAKKCRRSCCPAVTTIGTRAIFAFMIAPIPCPRPPEVCRLTKAGFPEACAYPSAMETAVASCNPQTYFISRLVTSASINGNSVVPGLPKMNLVPCDRRTSRRISLPLYCDPTWSDPHLRSTLVSIE